MSKNTNISAFPVSWPAPNAPDSGMTLRDYFAAAALNAASADELASPTHDGASYKGVAVRAYLYADAMLLERDK